MVLPSHQSNAEHYVNERVKYIPEPARDLRGNLPSETEPSREVKYNTALDLRERLQLEIDCIRANTSTWKGARRDVRFSTKLLLWFLKGML
jgi:CDP-diacylglycerol--glycerol-3-phosphate 3-phosphatidyltransferase